MTNQRDAYFAALGTEDQKTLRAALNRAHVIRQFEIELYWKRASYFWILQAAVFAAFGLVWKDADKQNWSLIPVALACLGVLTAEAGWLASQGSKFWQSNWEFHIDMLEDDFEGRLHKTVRVGSLGARWSVSGVNDRLSLCFLSFWLLVAVLATVRACGDYPIQWGLCIRRVDWERTLLFALIMFTTLGAMFLFGRLSDLRGELIELGAGQEAPPIQRVPRFRKAQAADSILKRTAGT